MAGTSSPRAARSSATSTPSRTSSKRPVPTRLLAVLAICLAASLPYASTINNYFVNDDFGVVQLLTQKPLLYFPKWFVTSWMDNIWGATQDEIRPFPALTYQLAGLWGATSPVANHAANIAFHAASALLVLAVARIACQVEPPRLDIRGARVCHPAAPR